MELWFMYALLSALFAGLHAFFLKIAATHNHNADANTAIGSLTAAVLGWILIAIFNLWQTAWLPTLMFAIFSGVVYSFGAAARVSSLTYIDTTIFFPLYKTFGPIIAVVAGLLFFNEILTGGEIFGILLSISIPLLLLHKDESTRQKSLRKGLILLGISVVLIMISQIVNKHATTVVGNILLFATAIQSFTFFMSGSLWYRHSKKIGLNLLNTVTSSLIKIGLMAGLFQGLAFYTFLKAFELGALSIVFTINSLYILIPIVLSIIVYKEHWNARKAFAITLSIAALWFLR